MTCLKQLRCLASRTAVLALIALPVLLDSCTSTSDLPANLPDIALNGSSATPPHHMAGYEYPFDSNGNYVSDWAAEGERRAGRSASATNSDEENWSKSHGNGASSSKKKSEPVKVKSTTTVKKSSGTKSGGTKPKTGGSVKYTVKSSDSLSSIARKFGTTTTAIKKANGLKSDKVRSGTVLVIPK
ncbi:MAG: LysM peptidoglycan-binding domain-containing protein [Verrucomicrobiaceae bacterium]